MLTDSFSFPVLFSVKKITSSGRMLVFANGGAKRKSRKVTKGKLTKPMDVRSRGQIKDFEKLLSKGPITLVLVYADWCGACHRFRENTWKEIESMPNKTMNISAVREDMFPETSLKNTTISQYPSLLLVGNDKKPAEFPTPSGTPTNVLPNNSKEALTKIVTSPMPTANEIANNMTAISTARKTATQKNTNSVVKATQPTIVNSAPEMEDLFENVEPPGVGEDLEDISFTPVSNPSRTSVVRGGGLYGALQSVIAKGTQAFRLRRKTSRRRKTRSVKKMQKRNKLGRFSRRR